MNFQYSQLDVSGQEARFEDREDQVAGDAIGAFGQPFHDPAGPDRPHDLLDVGGLDAAVPDLVLHADDVGTLLAGREADVLPQVDVVELAGVLPGPELGQDLLRTPLLTVDVDADQHRAVGQLIHSNTTPSGSQRLMKPK